MKKPGSHRAPQHKPQFVPPGYASEQILAPVISSAENLVVPAFTLYVRAGSVQPLPFELSSGPTFREIDQDPFPLTGAAIKLAIEDLVDTRVKRLFVAGTDPALTVNVVTSVATFTPPTAFFVEGHSYSCYFEVTPAGQDKIDFPADPRSEARNSDFLLICNSRRAA